MLTEKAKEAVNEIAVMGCFFLAFSCAVDAAIPSAAECNAARANLAELTSDDYKALKAKTKTNEQVGDALTQYADNEESAAGEVEYFTIDETDAWLEKECRVRHKRELNQG